MPAWPNGALPAASCGWCAAAGPLAAATSTTPIIRPSSPAAQSNKAYIGNLYTGSTAAFGTLILFNGGSFLTTTNSFVVKVTDAGASGSVTRAQRAHSVGIFRFWRDADYAIGALLTGALAEAFGLGTALADATEPV